jgi:hypothetical protein
VTSDWTGPCKGKPEARISESVATAIELKTLKKADLEKNKAKKIERQISQSPATPRFGQGAAIGADRREQRKRDQALGLIPFAIKLDGDLVKQLHALAQERKTSLNELVGELLNKGLKAK